MKRTLRSILINIGLLYCLFAWVSYGYDWAENIYKFVIWVQLLMSLCVLISDKVRRKAREKGRSIPKTVSFIYDIISLVLLVGWGSVLYGVLYFIQSIFLFAIYDIEDEVEHEQAI